METSGAFSLCAGDGLQTESPRGLVETGNLRVVAGKSSLGLCKRMEGAGRVLEHEPGAHQPDPAIGIAGILLQPGGKTGDHAARHFVLLGGRHPACRLQVG